MSCNKELIKDKFTCGCKEYTGVECITYTGRDLPNLGIARGDSLKNVLDIIDEKIGELTLNGVSPQFIYKLELDGRTIHLKNNKGEVMSSIFLP